VARPRPRQAIRPLLAERVARIAAPTVQLTAFGADVAGAVIPGGNAQVAYPAPASTASAGGPSSAARVRGQQEIGGHLARTPVNNNAVAQMAKSSASQAITPILKLNVIDSRYATMDLNVRTHGTENASVCHRYPQVRTFYGKRSSSGWHGGPRPRLHDLRFHCWLGHRTLGPSAFQGTRRDGGQLSAAHLDRAAEFRRLALNVRPRLTHLQSCGSRTRLRLWQQGTA